MCSARAAKLWGCWRQSYETETKAVPPETGTAAPESTTPAPSWNPSNAWNSAAVYTGGDTVSYGGRRYRAKWWTQGETPGSADVREDLGIVDGEPSRPQGVDNVPIDASTPQNTELTDFKVVGYCPSWKPDKL